MKILIKYLALVGGIVLFAPNNSIGQAVPAGMAGSNVDWSIYRGNSQATQFAELGQINAANVHKLKPVWEYHTGDKTERSTMHSNPIVVGGIMYFSTPAMRAVAVDAATGKQLWAFDPAPLNNGEVVRLRNRGVTYWKGAEGERIYHFVRERVYALDARTGALITTFGKNGFIDLRENLGVEPKSVFIEMTSPGAIYKNFLILGSRVNESYDASPGHIRAFDTVTGELKWIFHTIPQQGEPGHDTWKWVKGENYGGANAWGGVTIDEKRGWAFVATGSATEDFYGAYRKGNNLFSNCVIALDATTGERKWHYQTVHHDIWDYDNPPAPILITLSPRSVIERMDGAAKSRDAVVQLTKMGFVFVLDRDTGEPIFPIAEVPVPTSTVPGEETSPTQPMPILPRPIVRQIVTEADLTDISAEAHAHALQQFRLYQSGPIYTPISLQGNITTPGHLGGMEWHGASYDEARGVMYINANELPTINRLRPLYNAPSNSPASPVQKGREVFEKTCTACHGFERKGYPPLIPALLNPSKTDPELKEILLGGRNAMPSFKHLPNDEIDALIAYIRSDPAASAKTDATVPADRYTMDGYPKFEDKEGYPGIKPPWGTLNAVDMHTGNLLWKVPLGEYPALVARGIRNTGTPNFGGAVATSGGIVFIAATADEKIRAFEQQTGRVLWEYQLPAGGYATPSVYMVNGRQYVAIAAGGSGKNGTKSGDTVMAFALPETDASDRGAFHATPDADGWISLFDGKTLNGWAHVNGWNTYMVEDGAIVGRTVMGSPNSFLCSLEEFDDFELELETMVGPVTNQGIQIRTQTRPVTIAGPNQLARTWGLTAAGRVNGPQVEVRRHFAGQPSAGMIYGEALMKGWGVGWLTPEEKVANAPKIFLDDAWNKYRIVAKGARIETWVNGIPVEDLVNEEVFKTHSRGFIGLQIHALTGREPGFKESGLPLNAPVVMKWRNIRIRPLPKDGK